MKKILKWSAILFGLVALLIVVFGILINESKPEGNPSQEADGLARKMMDAVNKAAWDTTGAVQWTFAGRHSFLWDKDRHLTKVSWGDTEVLLDINEISGKAFRNGEEITGEEAQKLIKKAWEFFCNDSFWLNPVVKAFDPGTERSLVALKDGRQGLKVAYTSGGVTPGDSYVWILDENGLPESWKMWVKIIPVGGVENSWEGWIELATGAKVATLHKGSALTLELTDVKGAGDLAGLGITKDPFTDIID